MAGKQQVEGTIMRGADGSLYFLRKEVLEASKVTEADMKEFLEEIVETKAKGRRSLTSTALTEAVTVRGPFKVDGHQPAPAEFKVKSTVMCSGNMKLFDVEVIDEM